MAEMTMRVCLFAMLSFTVGQKMIRVEELSSFELNPLNPPPPPRETTLPQRK